VITVDLDLSRAQIPVERRLAIFQDLQARLSATAGVVSAAQVMLTPVGGGGWDNEVGPDGTRAAASGKQSFFNSIGPGYFRTMGIGLLAGRDFTDRDNLTAPKVAIVNEVFARKFFNTPNVVGRTFRQEAEAGKPEPLYEIVGVVRATKYYELREEFLPIGYVATLQDSDPNPGATFMLRVQGSPGELAGNVKAAVSQVNPVIGIQLHSFPAQLEESLLREKLMATLSGGFALLAGLLAMLGLYGVIAYMVARRRNEIGVRIALGAGRGRVVRLVLRETALLLAIGLAAGVVIALWAGRAASTLLYGMKPYDPVSIGTAVVALGITALAATYAPARRAAALDPMTALREE
jgi:predicted permease